MYQNKTFIEALDDNKFLLSYASGFLIEWIIEKKIVECVDRNNKQQWNILSIKYAVTFFSQFLVNFSLNEMSGLFAEFIFMAP